MSLTLIRFVLLLVNVLKEFGGIDPGKYRELASQFDKNSFHKNTQQHVIAAYHSKSRDDQNSKRNKIKMAMII